jgi:inhibitor of cysteine peptidase
MQGEDDMKRFDDPAQPIRVAVGETFALALPGNPTTGYTWQLETDEEHLLLLGQEFEPGKSGVGSGGQEVFRLHAQAPGEVELACEYRRPWSDAVRDSRRFQIVIEP